MNIIVLLYWNLTMVLLPLLISNTIHMLVVKKRLLTFLEIPIWVNGFGENKTLRGFLVMTSCNAIFCYLANRSMHLMLNPAMFGAMIGFTYSLSELPNSWLKRRLGIAPGSKAHNHSTLFSILDKLDSAAGVAIITWYILYLINPTEFPWYNTIPILTLCNSLFHAFFSWILVLLKIKRSF